MRYSSFATEHPLSVTRASFRRRAFPRSTKYWRTIFHQCMSNAKQWNNYFCSLCLETVSDIKEVIDGINTDKEQA